MRYATSRLMALKLKRKQLSKLGKQTLEIVMDNNEYGQSPIVFNHHKIKIK